ncbi:MAG: NADH:ubiquinone reductase (Na(+)-transporting) subunit C [Draconibacterium sp.]|nr:MAG: NADH:ubiquinone reductase (Na(+)-transporting) subunit C [Draconibacterium sp.]
MNRNSDTYTFIYASVMVILVAAILATVSMGLKPLQKKNVAVEKKRGILTSVNIESTSDNAEKLYDEKIVSQYVVNSKGEKVEGDAFTIDLKKENAKPLEQRKLPVFECKTEEGIKYILPMRGAGLWGPIWGYVSLNTDMNTIYGANFAHEGETPGLGAEIATDWFQKMFEGKKIFDNNGKLVSITVAKAGQEAPVEHKVDGISGGTITSKGLQNMLEKDFNAYKEFLKKKKS